jgi:preprotein translocase subunit SecG
MSPLHIFLLVSFALVCFLLIASVLLQTGKGGGMAGLGGGSSDSAFGAHTANVLQKFTMYCVIAFFGLVISLSHMSKRSGDNSSVMDDFVAPVEASKTEVSAEPVPPAETPAALAIPATTPQTPLTTPVQTAPAVPAVPAAPAEPAK